VFDPVELDRQVPELVARLATSPVEHLSVACAVQLVVDAERVISWASAVQAAATGWLAGVDASRPPASSSPEADAPSVLAAAPGALRPDRLGEWCADELAVALHATRARAGHLVAFACGLARLPRTYALLRDGRIDVPRARVLTEALVALTPAVAEAVEQAVLPDAPGTTSGKLRAAVTREIAQLDPQGVARRNRAQRAGRSVAVYPDPASATSTVCATGLDAADARAVWESLDAIARAGDHDHDPRGLDARRADAFVALLTGHNPLPDWATAAMHVTGSPAAPSQTAAAPLAPLPVGGLPSDVLPSPAGSPHADPRRRVALHLVTAAGAAPGATGSVTTGSVATRPVGMASPPSPGTTADTAPAWLSGYGWLTSAHARSLVAQSSVRPRWAYVDPATGVLRALTGSATEPPGAPGQLALPTGGYRPPPALSRLVRARDLTCRFPGCRQPAHRADLDHLRPWPGGPTAPANLWVLCRRHHRLKHCGLWTVEALTAQGTNGPVRWTSPTGQVLTSAPPDYVRRG
jgi:hypothetical protein